jgi:hypothetical protein
MLFDLQGKRRHVVQATYVTLAVLMGGGLVFFGVGSSASGGLLDAFKGGGGGDSGNSVIEKRVDKNEDKARANPRSQALRKALVRDYYSLATSQSTQQGTFSDDGKKNLAKASANWQAYLKITDKPDESLANVAIQIYDPLALNKPKDAQEAARLIAEGRNNASAYLNLVQYAALAGDTRTADLAGQKAIDLAPKSQKKAARAQVKQLKKPQTTQSGAAGAPQQ